VVWRNVIFTVWPPFSQLLVKIESIKEARDSVKSVLARPKKVGPD
jgi:hypothetical protein